MVTPPYINDNDFPYYFQMKGTLYIPAGTQQNYAERGWGNYFMNIVVMDEQVGLTILEDEQGQNLLKCAPDTPIDIYDLSGKLISSTKATEGITKMQTTLRNKVGIVKVGDRSVKVIMK